MREPQTQPFHRRSQIWDAGDLMNKIAHAHHAIDVAKSGEKDTAEGSESAHQGGVRWRRRLDVVDFGRSRQYNASTRHGRR